LDRYLCGLDVMGRDGIILKSVREIEMMRSAGLLLCQVLDRTRGMVRPGVTTAAIDKVAEAMILDAGAVPLFKGVENPEARFPFPASLCASVNEEVVHGIPNDRPLTEGDILTVDCGVELNGYCSDSAVTVPVGRVSGEVQRLMKVTREALRLAVSEMQPGRKWSEVARKIQAYVESNGMSVVRDFVGHGIGRSMHEEPKVPNYWNGQRRNTDFKLRRGMVLAVEPMVNLGRKEVCYAGPDRWTVRTKDKRPAAHYEHTVAVTDNGGYILSGSAEGVPPGTNAGGKQL